MSEAGVMSLSLKIAGDGYEDFFPYELTLEEGFSRVYHAELTVFTKTLREMDELRELLERKASIIVSQRLTGGSVTRSRYVHGIITGVAHLGVAGGESKSCFRYKIIIESELIRLGHTKLNSPWYRKTPPAIIEEICSRYGIRAHFSEQFINQSSFSKNSMFEQSGVSDLDFIRYLAAMYGISWSFVHEKSDPGNIGTAALYFSEGWLFPSPLYDYSVKRDVPEVERFDFINFNEGQNIWKMNKFRMENTIGIDGMEVTASYPQNNSGSHEWRWGLTGHGKKYHSYGSLFHGYNKGASMSEIDADIKRSLEAYRMTFALEKENRKGEAENIALMPGLILELRHFYGQQYEKTVTALITDSRLRVRVLWPRDLVSPPVDGEPEEISQVEFNAKDWGKDSGKRFCRKGETI